MKRRPTSRDSVAKSRELRRSSTKPESLLWNALRSGQLARLKFRRQHPIGPYIADFHCHSASLVVEIDGMSHDDRGEDDRERTEYLCRSGLKVIRVLNDDGLEDLEAVGRYITREAGVQLG